MLCLQEPAGGPQRRSGATIPRAAVLVHVELRAPDLRRGAVKLSVAGSGGPAYEPQAERVLLRRASYQSP